MRSQVRQYVVPQKPGIRTLAAVSPRLRTFKVRRRVMFSSFPMRFVHTRTAAVAPCANGGGCPGYVVCPKRAPGSIGRLDHCASESPYISGSFGPRGHAAARIANLEQRIARDAAGTKRNSAPPLVLEDNFRVVTAGYHAYDRYASINVGSARTHHTRERADARRRSITTSELSDAARSYSDRASTILSNVPCGMLPGLKKGRRTFFSIT
jgi:hypothetical protein